MRIKVTGFHLYVFYFKQGKSQDSFKQLEMHFQKGNEPIEIVHEAKFSENFAHAVFIFVKSILIGHFKQKCPRWVVISD